jgi:membrane-bound lytic murein transglycosylase B
LFRIFFLALVISTLPIFAARDSRPMTQTEQMTLLNHLPADLRAGELAHALASESFFLYEDALLINLHGRDGSKYYESFQNAETHDKLRQFLSEHAALLGRVQSSTGVPPEIVVAILMIETRLGTITGDYPCADLFLTLQFLPDRTGGANLDSAFARDALEGDGRSRAALASVLTDRAATRSKWAMKQLRSLIEQFPHGKWRSMRGSWAGALGFCQFLPTSRKAYAADGDGDGRIDLFTLADAAFSVGNYLKENGWKVGQNEARKRKVIRRYNHSYHYVDAVCELASVGNGSRSVENLDTN